MSALTAAMDQVVATCKGVSVEATCRTADEFDAMKELSGAVEMQPLTGRSGGGRWTRRWFRVYVAAVEFAIYAPDTYDTRPMDAHALEVIR